MVFWRQNGLLGWPLGCLGEAGCPSGLPGDFQRDFWSIWGLLGRFRGAVGHPFSARSKSHFERDCVLLGNRRAACTGRSFLRPRASIWVAKPLPEQSPGRFWIFLIFQKHSDRVGSEILKFEPLWRGNEEAMGKFVGGFLIQWGNQGESE